VCAVLEAIEEGFVFVGSTEAAAEVEDGVSFMKSAWLHSRFSHDDYSRRTEARRLSATESLFAHHTFFLAVASSRKT